MRQMILLLALASMLLADPGRRDGDMGELPPPPPKPERMPTWEEIQSYGGHGKGYRPPKADDCEVPEPGTCLMIGGGLLAIAAVRALRRPR